MNFSKVTGPFTHPAVGPVQVQGPNDNVSNVKIESSSCNSEINFLEMTERFLAQSGSGGMNLQEVNEVLMKERNSCKTNCATNERLGFNTSESTMRTMIKKEGTFTAHENDQAKCDQNVESIALINEPSSQFSTERDEERAGSSNYMSNSLFHTHERSMKQEPKDTNEFCEPRTNQTDEIILQSVKGCQNNSKNSASKIESGDQCEMDNTIAKRELPYKCKFCGIAFSLFSHLKRHVKTHEDDAEFSCNTCGRVYVSDDQLQRHKKKRCRPKTHQCTECGNTYRLMHQLQSHLRTHTGEKPYLCETCGQGFSQKESLRLHERTHTGYKPYKCAICGKTFNSTKCLHRHELTHSGERNYKCDICDKSYQRNDHLRRHKRVHGEEPRFKCSYCGKGFHQKVNLEEHERIHTGTRPFVCSVCGKSFTQRGNLKSHLIKHSFV